jgi:prefoldin subunit 2
LLPSHLPYRLFCVCPTVIIQLNYERDEHKLVVDILGKLESERKAFRLVGSVLVERTVGDVLPTVSQNFEGVSDLASVYISKLWF